MCADKDRIYTVTQATPGSGPRTQEMIGNVFILKKKKENSFCSIARFTGLRFQVCHSGKDKWDLPFHKHNKSLLIKHENSRHTQEMCKCSNKRGGDLLCCLGAVFLFFFNPWLLRALKQNYRV